MHNNSQVSQIGCFIELNAVSEKLRIYSWKRLSIIKSVSAHPNSLKLKIY